MKITQTVVPDLDLDEIVLTQLGKILMHPLFLSSDILSRFLSFIVKEALAGREDQLKEYTVALQVLNKPVSFEPSHNAIVRIHARRLRNALLAYYDQKGSGDDCMITIPKGRYVPLFEKLDNRQLSRKTPAPSLYSIGETKKNRIAFMPFKIYHHNNSHASFVDSLGEELTRQFSNRSELSVLSYHTTRMLSPDKSEIKDLVSSYQVEYLISGSIRFEHSKIKVFVELIATGSESQLWSAVYYQTAGITNFFRAVDNIASRLMTDLCKIKCLECNNKDQLTDILYIDSYSKNPESLKRLANESY